MNNDVVFQEMIEDADDLIACVDKTGRCLYVNQVSEKIVGLLPDDCVGWSVFDWVHPDDREKTREAFEGWVRSGQLRAAIENRLVNQKTGQVFHVLWTISLHYDDQGELVRANSIGRDITEKKQTEMALDQAAMTNAVLAELSRELLTADSLDAISDQVLESARNLTESWFGYVGFIDPNTGYLVTPTLTREIWTKCRILDKRIVFETFTGLFGWILDHRVPLMTNNAQADPRSSGVPEGHIQIKRFLSAPAMAGRELMGQVAVANADRDYSHADLQVVERLASLYALAVQRFRSKEMLKRKIADLKRTEAELIRAKEAAEAASRAKSQFLTVMSHEIRTPMNAIMGMTDLTLESELTDRQREDLEMVRDASEHLLSLINDILQLSRIETGHVEIIQRPFPLRACMTEIMQAFSQKAEKKGLWLVFWIDPDVPDDLVGDIGRLRQIIYNLVGNAIKFTSEGEVVAHVSLLRANETYVELCIQITDTGIGVPEEKQAEIFDPFAQADASISRPYGGAGLGLAISRSLAQMMGGDLALESEPGAGSTFGVTLSLGRDAQELE